jgi:lipid-A-disaccharide synthase
LELNRLGLTADKNQKKILIIAGEASGDLHGSNLVREMLSLDPKLKFFGVGGEKMMKAGVNLVADITEMAVVGITEALFKLRNIYWVYRKLKKSLTSNPPSLIILIDYPDFNLLFARAAKKKNIPIVYYISPQIWAWRKKRVKLMARLIKKMIVIFPFEKKFYQEANIDVDFVGHPLLDSIRPRFSRDEAFRKFSLNPEFTTIGLLPGSRMSEINRHLPPMLKAIPLISRKLQPVQFIIPVAPGLDFKKIKNLTASQNQNLRVVENNIYEVMQIADLLLVASGTATVEATIMGTPMIVVYRVSPFTYLLGKMLIKVKNIGMVNIIAGKTIVPELIQKDLNPEKITHTVLSILKNPSTLKEMRKELAKVREKIGKPGASGRAARIINELLQQDDINR